MPTTLAREVVQEPERRHRAAAVGTPAARQPVGAVHSNGELARLARAGGSPPPAALHAWSNRVARASLAVTHPDDPVEREAERVASDVVHRRTVVAQAAAPADPPIGRSRPDGTSAPGARAARDPATGPAPPAPAAEAGSVVEHAEEIAEGGQVEVPQSVASLIASPGTGVPLEPGVQARVAPVLGADLSSVRVHQGPDASAAAAALQARAFTVGADIFLGEGESPTDLELMAHESTHVVQQQAVGVYRVEVARLSLGTVMPDWLIHDIQSIPGYSVVSTVIGSDPITGESAAEGRQGFVEKLLTFGPFGAASGPVLQAAKVLDDVFTMLSEGLERHNLTFARVLADLDSAWEEMSITEGVDFNLAIARRYLSAIVNDVKAFLSEIADAVIAKVRSVLAAVAEPLLEKDSIAPYWSLAKKVLHTNPLTGEDVPATTVEILTEFLKVIGQQKVLDQMTERGTLQKTADWVDSKIDQFKGIVGQVAALLEQAGAALSPANLPNLLDTLPALADQAFSIIKQIGDFAKDVIAQVLVLVKDSLLAWLSSYAKKIPGYELLTVILEKDPFTGDAVPRTAENLIKGFILLLPGGDEMYAKLAESGVIANAAGRITSAMTELNISWALITDTFLGIWNLVTLESLLSPIETFNKILDQFGDPLERIIRFAAVVIQVVVELILRLMNFPPEIFGHILSQVESAIDDIKRDPVEFLLNVVEAMKQGFSRFFDNILEHLLKGLAAWMFRGLKSLGIETPTELTLEAAITLVIQVSGVTVELLWQRLAAKIGQDKVDKIRAALELAGQAFDFIKDVQERGIEAIWDKISEQLSNLWDLIFDAAKSWIMKEIVNKAIAKVLSMLDPTGIMAVVNSCIAFFKAVQSVLDYMRELLELIDSYVSTVAQIAKGNVGPGAAMLETGLANAVPVAIGFLANQAGLGDVPEQVKQIIIDLRAKIVEAIDWLIDKAVSLAQSALNALGLGDKGEPDDGGPLNVDEVVPIGTEKHHILADGPSGSLVLHSLPTPLVDLPDPEGKLAPLLTEYATARTAYDQAEAAKDAPTIASTKAQVIAAADRVAAVVLQLAAMAAVDVAELSGLIAATSSQLALAMSAHQEWNDARTPSEKAKDKKTTFASGGGNLQQVGGGDRRAATADVKGKKGESAADFDQRVEERMEARRRWLLAESERWEKLSSVTRNVMTVPQMLRLAADPEFNAKIDALDAKYQQLAAQAGGVVFQGETLSPAQQVAVAEAQKVSAEMAALWNARAAKPSDFLYPVDNEQAQAQMLAEVEQFVPLRGANDQGVGSSEVVHAERLVWADSGSQAIGVSQPPCGPCQTYFTSVANQVGKVIVLRDNSQAVWIFVPGAGVKSPKDFGL